MGGRNRKGGGAHGALCSVSTSVDEREKSHDLPASFAMGGMTSSALPWAKRAFASRRRTSRWAISSWRDCSSAAGSGGIGDEGEDSVQRTACALGKRPKRQANLYCCLPILHYYNAIHASRISL